MSRKPPRQKIFSMTIFKPVLLCVFFLSIAISATPSFGQLRLGDICRVKGQEENQLQGLGLVVGLNGTGDSGALPTTRALARMMSLMGSPIARDTADQEILSELSDGKNVAIVLVTATVPSAGARQGDNLNCEVHAVGNAKSLEGGYLMMTALLGPVPGSEQVYALAQGPIHVSGTTGPLSTTVHNGCRLEADFFNVFALDGIITLVLDEHRASFETSIEIARSINDSGSNFGGGRADSNTEEEEDVPLARALDQVNIEVRIPSLYRDDPVDFISQILEKKIFNPQSEARVVINERAGTIVFSENVMIGAVAITHGNLAIETGQGQFIPLDQAGTDSTKLAALVEALNALQATDQDIIEIIKGLEKTGQLFGRLIIE